MVRSSSTFDGWSSSLASDTASTASMVALTSSAAFSHSTLKRACSEPAEIVAEQFGNTAAVHDEDHDDDRRPHEGLNHRDHELTPVHEISPVTRATVAG